MRTVTTDYETTLSIIENLPALFKIRRVMLGKSMRQVAQEMDTSYNTIASIEHGRDHSTHTLRKAMVWMIQNDG